MQVPKVAALAALVAFFPIAYALAQQSIQHPPPSRQRPQVRNQASNAAHTQWIVQSLEEMQTVKVGMTRAQLLKVFTTEGGLSAPQWRSYVYRHCPYIKVDVMFRPVGQFKNSHHEGPADVITQISRPFLQWSIMD